jgi:hypothetical protein
MFIFRRTNRPFAPANRSAASNTQYLHLYPNLFDAEAGSTLDTGNDFVEVEMKRSNLILFVSACIFAGGHAIGAEVEHSDTATAVTLLSETAEGWYVQSNEADGVTFLERNSDLVQSIAWRNCMPFGPGTVCEVYGRSIAPDMWGKWRTRGSDRLPRVPGAEFRRPDPKNDPWDMN